MRSNHLTIAAILALPLVMLPACSRNKQGPPRTVPVVTESAVKKDIPLQIKAIGNVEAFITVAVKCQVSGEIAEVFFREGQDVGKGEKLFQIDPRPFEAALRQAEANLARDRAQAKNAELEAQRYAALAEKGFVSRQEYDRVRTGFDALSAVVQADEAAVENARLQLEYTTIVSPIDGRTGSIQIKKGNVVKANDLPLVTINQISPILVTFSVPEQDLAVVKKHRASGGLTVEAAPQGAARPASGTLSFIDNAVNTSTGTILLKAVFPNRERTLWPGQFVDVSLTLTTERDRIVVPPEAVQTGQQGQYVYVIKDDMTADLRVVTPGRSYQNWTIIDKGVEAGEKVVTDGQLRLVPGAKVEIKNEKAKQDPATEPQRTQSGAQTRAEEKKKNN
ncbi:MAG TPA: efflux RND transporter periplasmic adaptor subunit [Nitrospirota bacterium]|nr:efflux RND transporter periplasmic adaptor subunit [Nitrospirota bacterium]